MPGTFEPDHQIELLQQGHHVLPWMSWPQGDPESERFQGYHGRLVRYFGQLELPFSMRGTQWNSMLVGKEYRDGPVSNWAGVIAPDGTRVRKLSPFGPYGPWKDPAKAYVDTAAMRRVQEIYPAPPRIFWVSNNEPPDLRWAKHGPLETLSKRYLDKYGEGRSDEFKRRVVGEGWIERYKVMFDAMRGALVKDWWQANVRFVGLRRVRTGHTWAAGTAGKFTRWSASVGQVPIGTAGKEEALRSTPTTGTTNATTRCSRRRFRP